MHLLRHALNKYLLATLGFVALMLFFDRNDVFTQLERRKQLKSIRDGKAFYTGEIEKTRKELTDFQHNPAAFERYAREHYLMKRDDEDVFVIQADSLAAR